jgi:molybdopterin/thiamine biosynthesis adenylyltransferase
VGTIGIVDFDDVEESNLQRQIAHGTAAVGHPKIAPMARPRTERTSASFRTRPTWTAPTRSRSCASTT